MQSKASAAVVIVEDDQSMNAALARILRLGGYESLSFPSAEALLADGAALDPSCFIFDVQLPGMTGFDLQARLSVGARDRPVIFISAFDDMVARGRAERAEAVAFLAKPFSGRVLLEAVERAVYRRAGAAA